MKFACLLAVSLLAFGQVAGDANQRYKTKEGRAGMASSLDSASRDARQRPADLVASLAIEPGSTVVDLGTGPGYMLPYLSRAVGRSGKVIAEDIHSDFLDRARDKARVQRLTNVEFVLGTEKDPLLPPASADLILVLDAYHHFDYPDRMLVALRRALRPNGRMAVVEFYKAGCNMEGHIRLDAEGVAREIERQGFRLLTRRDHQPGVQYIAIFGVL